MPQVEKNKVEARTLYLVATPIGNLSDLSERALKVLNEVDFIAAEDTRNSLRLLTHFGIKKELYSYFEHNRHEHGAVILARLLRGESCALVTDAGMPAISDPGEDLVRLCAENGVAVTCIPGASAVVTALALSALSTRRFAFEGFLPVQKNERRARLEEIKDERRTLIFYEAPHKLRATLKDLLTCFGDRKISFCRELTKINEEVFRTTLENAVAFYEQNDPRGEYVIVLEGAEEAGIASQSEAEGTALLSPDEAVAANMEKGLSRMDAIKAAAKERGLSKSEFYKLLSHEN